MATIEAVLNRRANRRAVKALHKPGPVVVPAAADVEPELTPDELVRIHKALMPHVPTTTWADDICDAMKRRKSNGKRLVPYTITSNGKLKTKITSLLSMIRNSGIYPPPADDVESCTVRTHAHHIGSEMQACYCRDCAGVKLWPAGYIVNGWRSYTCATNRAEPVDELPMHRVTTDGSVTVAGMGEQIVYHDHAWRGDSIALLWSVQEEPADVLAKLRAFHWREVTGTKKARVLDHGLSTVGSLANFLALGHDLRRVVGDAAEDVIARLERYPKDARPVGVRLIWQRTGMGKRAR